MSKTAKYACPTKLVMALAMIGMSSVIYAQQADTWIPTHTQALIPTAANGAAALSVPSLKDDLRLASQRASALPGDTALAITVTLNIRDEAGLNDLAQAVGNPADSRYRKFLKPGQFTKQYAPTAEVVAKVVAYLQRAGLTDITVSPSRLLVSARGNSAAVESAFHTRLLQFNYRGRDVFANASAAQVPAELGGIVQSVFGLQDVSEFRHRRNEFSKAALTANGSRASRGLAAHDPTEFAAIYHVGDTPAATGTMVGIIAAGDLTQVKQNLDDFVSQHQLNAPAVQVVNAGPAGSPYENDDAGNGEWSMDSQTIIGVSGGVKGLIFYAAPDNGQEVRPVTPENIIYAYDRAVGDDVVKVISDSAGGDSEDFYKSEGYLDAANVLFKQAVAQGQTISVGSGDDGAYDSVYDGINPKSPTDYSVDGEASSPYVVAVGGTTLYTNGTSYSSETAWSSTGGGVSKYEAVPAWQTSVLGSSATKRGLPDVAFDGDPSSGVLVDLGGFNEQIGGTSLSAPIFAALWARLETAHANQLGFAAPVLYQYIAKNPVVIHDVIKGNNGQNGYGYSAKRGWDYVSGWGSLDVQAFNRLLPAATN